MNDRALDDAVEPGGRLRLLAAFTDEVFEFVVDVFRDRLLQRRQIHVAGAHDRCGIDVINQRKQQMLKRGVFVLALRACVRAF